MDFMINRLNNNIDRHLIEMGVSRAEVGDEVIDAVVQLVLNDYIDNVRSPFFYQTGRLANIFAPYIQLLIVLCLAFTLVIGLIFFLISRWKHLVFRYYAFSFATAAIMVLIAPLALRIWGGYQRLNIAPESTYRFVIVHIERTTTILFLCSLVLITFQFIFIFISHRLRLNA